MMQLFFHKNSISLKIHSKNKRITKITTLKNLYSKITLGIMQLVVGDSVNATVLMEAYCVFFLMMRIFKI